MAKRDDDDTTTGFTGKRNKSWREIDAQRGKSKYHSRHDDKDQQKLERSSSYQKYKSAADSLFSGAELPDDPYFLDSLLDHPRERIVDKSLARLEALESEGRLKGRTPGSLPERLKSIELTSTDPDLQSRAKALREKIRH